MVSLPSGHPNRKPESQCAREVTEFWQLLFNVFEVYSVHLLSKYILNSLLTISLIAVLFLQSIFYTTKTMFYYATLIIRVF